MVVESSIPCDSLKALPIELLTPTCMGIVWAFENHPIQIEKFPVLGQSLIHFEKIWVCMGLTFMIQVWVLSTGFKTTKNHHFPCSKIDNLEVYISYNIYTLNTLPFETLYPSTPTGSGQDADHGAECDSRSLKRCCRKPGNMTVMAWLGVPCWHIQRGLTSATASCWKNLVMVNIHAAWWLQPDLENLIGNNKQPTSARISSIWV